MPSIKTIFEDIGWNVSSETPADRDTEVSFTAIKGEYEISVLVNSLQVSKITLKHENTKTLAIWNPKTKLYTFNADNTKTIKLDELKRQLIMFMQTLV